MTLAWIIFYWVLYFQLLWQNKAWQFDTWDITNGPPAQEQLNSVMTWSYFYGAWLYMGIVVNVMMFMRIARYMRIHSGLKAFYQVRACAASAEVQSIVYYSEHRIPDLVLSARFPSE
jgi:hypothetical protein